MNSIPQKTAEEKGQVVQIVPKPRSDKSVIALPETYSLVELENLPIPEPKWIVQGLIPTGVGLLCGKPKAMKSFLAQGLTIDKSLGKPVLGEFKCEPSRTLYISLELTASDFRDRQRTMVGRTPPELGMVTYRWPKLTEPKGQPNSVEMLTAWMDKYPDTRLIVVDAFQRIRVVRNSKQDEYGMTYEEIWPIRDFAEACDVAVLICHHTRKKPDEDPYSTILGSTGLGGAIKFLWALDRKRLSHQANLFVGGNTMQEKWIALSFQEKACRWKYQGDASRLKLTDGKSEILEVLEKAGKPLWPKDVAELTDGTRDGVRQALSRMLKDGLVERLESGYVPA